MDPIHKLRPISHCLTGRREQLQLLHQTVTELVIGIKREYPRGRNLSDAKIALTGKVSEGMVEHFDLRIGLQDFERIIGATTVDHDNPSGPTQFVDRAPNVRRLVTCNN